MPAYLKDQPLLRLLIVAVLYAAIAWGSLALVPEGGAGASLVWPSAAVGLAFIYFWGYEMWPALLLPLFLVLAVRGYSAPLSVGVALGNMLESLLGAFLLRRFGFDALIARITDALGLILISALCTLASATVITVSSNLLYAGVQPFSTPLWLSLWIGHTVSLLSFAPFTLYWGGRPFFTKTRQEITEGLCVFSGVVVIATIESWSSVTTIGPFALIYILVALLIWASLRTGPRGISLALAMTALITAAGIIYGHHTSVDTTEQLLQTQILLGVLSVIFLPFTSITEERKNALVALRGQVGQLEGALEKLSSEDAAKNDFIAILAHELRNPLSPILSSLELMKQTGFKEGNDAHATTIASHVHVMARLLDDLLDISRVSQKKFKLEREPVTLQSSLGQALEMARPYIEARGHSLSVSLPKEPLWLTADPVRLTQVFVNVLNNAAKYTDPGGEIALSAVREGDLGIVRIKDSGIGIEPARLSKVFDPFGGPEGAASSRGGLRIGLSLAKRMVNLHHGSIEVVSAGAGKGSEFIIKLPLPPVQMPLEAPTREVRSRFSIRALTKLSADTKQVRILVVDDNQAAADSLAQLLRNNGHPVTVAYGGQEALERAREFRPDAVLLDVGLPDLDGLEVGRRLRAQYGGQIAIIALTGFGQEEDRRKALDAGFNAHLTKPVPIIDVERKLTELRR